MIFYLIIGLIILMYALDLIVSLLNYNQRNKPIPDNVSDIYDEHQYENWLKYTMETLRFGLIRKTLNTLLMLGLLIFGFFGALQTWVENWFVSPTLQTLGFIGVIGLGLMIIGIPFSYYATFVIEEKYGFNKTKKKTFFIDTIKNLILMVVLLGGLVALIQLLYVQFQNNLWLFVLSAWVLLTVIILIVFVLNTKVFVKIFNKLTPLPEGTLKDRIEKLATEVGFEIKAISVMDASKRSTKLNAFFSGLGKTREVVLFDTLIEKMTEDEILSVLAHELGHAVHKDITKMLIERSIVFLIYAVILGFILQSDALATAFGLNAANLAFGLVLFTILIEPIDTLLGIPLNAMSRKAEYAADRFSTEYVDKSHMMSALRKLVTENFSNLNPHPVYVLLAYSHPSISERLKAIESQSSKSN